VPLREEVVACATFFEGAALPCSDDLCRAARQRAERAGVQVGEPLEDRNLGADGSEVYAITASTGA
ncbi:MAG: hypothetical protein H0V20_03370, partial [Actinobacteria bacterium]|nr:hypothetical protein [Actinomycetota bacterium]